MSGLPMWDEDGTDGDRVRGFVLSDLHLFTSRSDGERWEGDIARAAGEAEFLVLNGDIFDFRWSTLPSEGATLEAAVAWLDRWLVGFPDCRFVYVLGNHDGLAAFGDRLAALAALRGNLVWHPSAVAVGSALFLHGDLPLGLGRARSLRGPMPQRISRWGDWADRCYQVVNGARVPGAASRLHTRRRCARRIQRALADDPPYDVSRITDVYFGHTHAPFAGYRRNGLTFHNTGSAIRGMAGGLLPVEARGVRGRDR